MPRAEDARADQDPHDRQRGRGDVGERPRGTPDQYIARKARDGDEAVGRKDDQVAATPEACHWDEAVTD